MSRGRLGCSQGAFGPWGQRLGLALLCPALGRSSRARAWDLSFSRVASQRCSTKVQGKQEAEPPAWQQPLRAGWGQEQCQGESCEQLGAVGLLRAPWGFTWAPTSLCTLCSSAPHPPASPRASQGSSSACILPLPAAAYPPAPGAVHKLHTHRPRARCFLLESIHPTPAAACAGLELQSSVPGHSPGTELCKQALSRVKPAPTTKVCVRSVHNCAAAPKPGLAQELLKG